MIVLILLPKDILEDHFQVQLVYIRTVFFNKNAGFSKVFQEHK